MHTPASRASLLSTFTVLAVPLLAGLSGAKIKPLVWGCGLAALLGTTMLESGGGAPPNIGDAISIVSALFFAVQLFRTEHISRELPEGSALPLMAVSMAVVAGLSTAGAAAVHWEDAAATAASLQHMVLAAGSGAAGSEGAGKSLLELLYTSLCSTDLALFLELMALQSVSSTEAAMVYSMEPVSGAMMAYVFLGDRWGPVGWLGAAVILLASIVTQTQGALEPEEGEANGVKGAGGDGKEQ
jgi:drug/metabolite transporter (DMT)-like permease